MKLHKIISIFILCLTFFLSSCSLLPSPEETMGPPREKLDISADYTDIYSVIRGFIGYEDKIISLDENDKTKIYYLVDIDGDKEDEVITQYEHNNTFPECRLMVLKKGNKSWEKIYDEDTFNKNPVKSICFNDITGDDIPEALVMYEENNLAVYHYYGETLNKFSLYISNRCSEYTIADLNGSNGPDEMLELYCKNNDPEEFSTTIYRWNGFDFSDVTNEFREHYLEALNVLIKERALSPDDYRLALIVIEEQLRFGMNEEALKTAEKELALLKSIEYKNHLLGLKARALLALGKYEEARAAAYDAIKAGSELKEYAKKSKSVFIAPGLHYYIIADSYYGEKQYEKAKEIIKANINLPYAEAAQEIDAQAARDKVCDYIRNSKSPGSVMKDIVKWSQDNNIIINCISPMNTGNVFSSIFVIDYHINPADVHGKENIGGYIICWMKDGKFGYIYLSTINGRNDMPFMYGLVAANAQVFYNNKQIKLKVTYKNTNPDNYLPKSYTQYFLYENDNFKFAYK